MLLRNDVPPRYPALKASWTRHVCLSIQYISHVNELQIDSVWAPSEKCAIFRTKHRSTDYKDSSQSSMQVMKEKSLQPLWAA